MASEANRESLPCEAGVTLPPPDWSPVMRSMKGSWENEAMMVRGRQVGKRNVQIFLQGVQDEWHTFFVDGQEVVWPWRAFPTGRILVMREDKASVDHTFENETRPL